MSDVSSHADAGPSPSHRARGVRWDLSHLYAGPEDAALADDLERSRSRAEAFAARYRGHVAQLDAAGLAEAVDALEALEEPAARAQSFAQLLFASDTREPRHGALLQRVQEHASAIRTLLLFFELEWLAVGDAEAERLLAAPPLARRRHLLGRMRAYRPHVLGEAEEQLLEERANTGRRAFVRLFDETSADLRFRLDHAGQAREVGEEELLSLLHEPSRELRRAAARAHAAGLREKSRLLGFISNTLVHDKTVEDRLRRYADPMQERHLGNEIDAHSVEALLGACERRCGLVARYYHLKARRLGLERLEDFDRYAPLAAEASGYDFAAARRLVLDAYADFCPEMAAIARRFFEERWIDAELRPGKQPGAFCASGVPSSHPWVLMSYTGRLRDVMTLAHELGHGVHQYLARERGLLEQNAPLTTAETASVFGEMLVFRRLLQQERDPRTRLALLCGKLEDAFATVFRQVVMTRFEQRLHAARRSEGELAVERVNALWLESNRTMFGDAVHLGEDYGWSWLSVPHFVHAPFYCYAYAFGELLVLALIRRYDEEGPAFVPRYLELLRAGGSEAPAQLLARLGLDITDAAFWDGGLGLLAELVEEAEALAQGHGAEAQPARGGL